MESNPFVKRRGEQPRADLPVVVRTDRGYVYDLCDAYNARRSPDALNRGVEWYVHAGELRIGYSQESMGRTTKRIERMKQRESAIAKNRDIGL